MKLATDGFTLIELLITIVVLGLTIGGINSVFLSIQDLQRQSTYVDSATRAAQREIEQLRNNNYASLTPGQSINFASLLPANLPGPKTATAVVSQPTTDLRRVDATVTYMAGGKQRTVILSSLIGVIGITQ